MVNKALRSLFNSPIYHVTGTDTIADIVRVNMKRNGMLIYVTNTHDAAMMVVVGAINRKKTFLQ